MNGNAIEIRIPNQKPKNLDQE